MPLKPGAYVNINKLIAWNYMHNRNISFNENAFYTTPTM